MAILFQIQIKPNNSKSGYIAQILNISLLDQPIYTVKYDTDGYLWESDALWEIDPESPTWAGQFRKEREIDEDILSEKPTRFYTVLERLMWSAITNITSHKSGQPVVMATEEFDDDKYFIVGVKDGITDPRVLNLYTRAPRQL
jgi:hypothetical protein